MKYSLRRFCIASALFLLSASAFFACKNDMEKVKQITSKKTFPDISNKDIEVLYSDSGIVKAKLTSVQMDNYFGENPRDEFPKGMKLVFFDENHVVNSSLTADYAINFSKEKKFEARSNVVVINEKGEEMNTEHLIWEAEKERIYSDAFVKIKTADEIIYGDGFESNQNFTKYKIFKIKGTINLKD